MKRQPWFRLFAALAAASLIAAACGDDDDDDAAPDDDVEVDEDLTPGEPEPTDGFDGETISVGALTPTTGQVAIIGEPLTAGNQAYIDYVNEELGGVAGEYQLELVVEDTAYDPSTASAAYSGMRDDVVVFMQILGTPVVDALLPDLIDDDVVAAPATLDSKWVREPNLIPILGPYQIQAINGVDWYYNEQGDEGDVLCTLASDDEYGDTGVEGVEFAADNLGIEVAVNSTFPAPSAERPEQDFVAQVSELEGADCDVVFFVATPIDTGAFSTALEENPGYNPTVIGQSPTWLTPFAASAYMQENFFLAAEGPEYGDESVEGMVELTRLQEEYAPDVPADHAGAIYFQFGINQARATVQILETAVERGDLSREGIVRAMEEVGTLTFDGLAGDYEYGPAEERVPPTTSSIFSPNPDIGPGLELVERDYEADYAADFEFEEE
jgi:ABC-type branched-subunit amino acid transport system substrate-binding protein